MTEKIIEDYKQTVKRLQEELKEKSDMIFKLMDSVDSLKQENEELTEQLDEECLRVTKLATENTKLEQENKRMRSVFEEIREVILNEYLGGNFNGQQVTNIENKINEVLK